MDAMDFNALASWLPWHPWHPCVPRGVDEVDGVGVNDSMTRVKSLQTKPEPGRRARRNPHIPAIRHPSVPVVAERDKGFLIAKPMGKPLSLFPFFFPIFSGFFSELFPEWRQWARMRLPRALVQVLPLVTDRDRPLQWSLLPRV
jgi:hypothetical protein